MRLHPVQALARVTEPVVDQIGSADGRPVPRWALRLVLLITFVLFWIAFGTTQVTYRTESTGMGSMFFIAMVVALPFALVLTRPLPALVFSVVSAFVTGASLPSRHPGSDEWPWLVVQGLIIFALLYATGVRAELRNSAGAWILTSALFSWGVAPPQRTGWIVALGAIVLLGVLTGRLGRTRRDLRAQTQVSEEERARRVVLEERAQLARDLHDIVAHHMSLVVVQAETAPYRVPELGDAARDELLSISGTARKALTETRALLNVLWQETKEAEAAPQPGLHLLGELVENTRRAGVQLDAHIDGDVDGLREGRSLAGFRIAQEALANASRHARGEPVTLEVHGSAEGVRLSVVSGTDGEVVGQAPTTGHGIVGMRERSAAAGGTLEVGPTANGFAVRLFLPRDPGDPS
ncbi:sensor histidine kinase [Kineosporia succinea]|uniref:histidine kinase n=1 Tax=Kineosporia succinea TaxID=84632 RepID=A0ABT9NYE8_9ACTN|nr:histidine kinase [Kineosporia succinea]MDP9825272.1 signal transduction histidine kinase [Kineosporia succinea]